MERCGISDHGDDPSGRNVHLVFLVNEPQFQPLGNIMVIIGTAIILFTYPLFTYYMQVHRALQTLWSSSKSARLVVRLRGDACAIVEVWSHLGDAALLLKNTH